MENVLTFFQDNETTVVIAMIVIIILLMTIIIIIDKVSKKKDSVYTSFGESLNDDKEDLPQHAAPKIESYGNVQSDIQLPTLKNVSHTAPLTAIKYVEEDEELEKTNAKLELKALKENLVEVEASAIEKNVNNVNTEIAPSPVVSETAEISNTVEPSVAVIEEVQPVNIETEPVKENTTQIDLTEKIPTVDDIIDKYEDEQEENAIISVEEFNKVSNDILTSNDNEIYEGEPSKIDEYADEKDEPISIKELEVLYNTRELNAMEVEQIKEAENKTPIVEESPVTLPEFKENGTYKTTPFISPVFGLDGNQENIAVSTTANYEKLNDEIKRTNEFLAALKDLKKNLQ